MKNGRFMVEMGFPGHFNDPSILHRYSPSIHPLVFHPFSSSPSVGYIYPHDKPLIDQKDGCEILHHLALGWLKPYES